MTQTAASETGGFRILARDAIYNPAEPRHFMGLVPISGRVDIRFKNRMIAQSHNAVYLVEIGEVFLPPLIYLPMEDVKTELSATDLSTHCPLKGTTTYFDLCRNEAVLERDIAWAYSKTYDFAAELNGLIAFDSSKTAQTIRHL